MRTAFTDTMAFMGKRKGRPPLDKDTPPGEQTNVLIGGRVSRPVAEAFVAFVESYNREHVRTMKSAHIERALVLYLEANGIIIPPVESKPRRPS